MGGRKMIIGAVAALALAALALGACGGGDNHDKTPSASASPARPATVAASPSAAASATAASPATEAPGAATEVPTQAPQGGATSAPPAPPTTAPPPPPPPTQAPPPPPQNLALTVVAQDVKFSPSSLSAAAGAALTVTLDNRDAGVPHNIVFYAPGGGTLASSATITGPATATVAFTPPGAGSYTFKCSVHPQQMFGVLTVS